MEKIDGKIREYIGDGIYVAFDGWRYEVSVNDHRNPPCVYFEPEHVDRFMAFKNRIGDHLKNEEPTDEKE